MQPTSSSPRVVLGVGGGIAAYKACELLRRLKSDDGIAADVTVVPTEHALRFVGAATFEALSGRPVYTDVFADVPSVAHVSTGQHADLVVIAPATADLLARAATGRADDLLTATLLVTRVPVLMAPAMHTEMWTHPATALNVETLRSRGVVVLDPAVGRLTGADSGAGRLPDPEHLAQVTELLLHRPDALPRDLVGRRIVVTAGGTREPLDPVRFLGNRSSGRQGFALALVAAARGADVTLLAANTALSVPPGVSMSEVGTAEELRRATLDAAARADAVIMAAAVADFRPADRHGSKIKKSAEHAARTLELTENADILAELVRRRNRAAHPVIVGFAAETGDASHTVAEYGRAKLARKGCDVLVVNDVSGGAVFGRADNAATILSDDGTEQAVPRGPKALLAAAVCDVVAHRLTSA
ncbi:MAG: phosphopantothenoylcysteine decarboxylase [Actinobacteria bacterium 69-20]|nr:bifunctional phosphopantothenoylcysteine decarboxylase/phosphopantothenate--cysteine ligase CoaBC [Actinomycetota bacterium]OJV25879.1 MAG: phosphopantothenoylcysteine decarboxylase [Actinobacteria bacterium 69-20]